MIPVTSGVDLTENQVPFRRRPWAKSARGTTSSGDGRGRASWPLATRRRPPIRRQPGDCPVLGRPGPGAAPRPGGLVGPLALPANATPHRPCDRGPRVEPAPRIGRDQRPGGLRGQGHPPRPARAWGAGYPLDPHHRPDPPAPRGPGRAPTRTTTAPASRLVSARGRRTPSRAGQRRHRRRAGHQGRPAGRGPQRRRAARRPGRVVADGRPGDRPGRRRGVDRALAHPRATRLCPVRQRHDLPGDAHASRCHRPGDAAVLEPRGHPRVRPAARDGLPGDDRELQRSVASQGLGAVHARLAGRAPGPLGQVRGGGASHPSGPDRGGAAATPLPQAVAAEPPGASPRPGRVSAEDGCLGIGGGAGAQLRRRYPVAESPGPRRVRPGCGADAVLRLAEARTDGAAYAERVESSYSEKAFQRVTGINWHLPTVALSTDRDHLAPVPLLATNPETSVTPGSLRPRASKTSWFWRTIEVIHAPRPFAPRRFSSERQCPPPAEPTQATHPPPTEKPARRRTPRADDGGLEHPL